MMREYGTNGKIRNRRKILDGLSTLFSVWSPMSGHFYKLGFFRMRAERKQKRQKGKKGKKSRLFAFFAFLPFLLPPQIPSKEADFVKGVPTSGLFRAFPFGPYSLFPLICS